MKFILRLSGVDSANLDFLVMDIDPDLVRAWLDFDIRVSVAFGGLLFDDRIGKPFYVSVNFPHGEFCGSELLEALPPEVAAELEDGLYVVTDDFDLDALDIEVEPGRADCPQLKFYGDDDAGFVAYEHQTGDTVSGGPFSIKTLYEVVSEYCAERGGKP